MAVTMMKLPSEVYVQEIEPNDFSIKICNCNKRYAKSDDYFNLGFFTYEAGGRTVPVGNLAIDGKIIAQACDQADWINVAKKRLTTVYTTTDGMCSMTKTDSLTGLRDLKMAVSGIPIIRNGRYVDLKAIKSEGYFGNELYDTWHGFLGIRHNKLVYVAMRCNFDSMCWALVALGIYDAIKLDGGGSFIIKDDKIIKATDGNRKIHNVGIWK